MQQIRIEYLPLAELVKRYHPDNPKEHDIGGLITSMRRFGFKTPGGIDEKSGLFAEGHGRTIALAEMQRQQMDAPKGIEVRGDDWYAPVIRGYEFDTPQELMAYLVTANRMTELGGWDEPKLAEVLQEIANHDAELLKATGYDEDDLQALLEELTPHIPTEDPGAQMDKAAELQKKWQVERGQLWSIGKHRLLCGDCTNAEGVGRLMDGDCADASFTSPPYADQRDYGNDNLSLEKLSGFIPASAEYVDVFCVNLGLKRSDGAIIPYWNEYINSAQKCGLKMLSWNVWDQGQVGSVGKLTAMFPIEHEFIFIFGKQTKDLIPTIPNADAGTISTHTADRQKDGAVIKKAPIKIRPYRELGTVARVNVQLARNLDTSHPAMFPPELPSLYIEALVESGYIAYDPFGGSGTTMVACEQLGRQCRMIEIEPKYCAVILERMSGMGLTPELLNNENT